LLLLTKYCQGHHIKEDELGAACGTHVGGREIYAEFCWRNRSERDHVEGLDVDGRIILKWILRLYSGGGMDWIHLAQDRCKWLAVVNTVMSLRAS
jgi:hypothetical protein